MTAKERYDEIIQQIEEMVTTQRLQAKDIAEIIARDRGMPYRDLATVLGFMTGEKLISYIRSRKYQAAYRFMIEAKDQGLKMSRAIRKAKEIADVQEQSTLNTAFQKLFGLTPGEAFKQQDASRLIPPKSWDEISCEETMIEEARDSDDVPEMIFGIDRAIYERITKINDLEAFYGVTRDYSMVAVKLSDELNISLEDAFSYVEGFQAERDAILDDEESSEEQISEVMEDNWLWDNASNPDMIYCCIHCGVSVSSAIWAVRELPELGHSPIAELSPFFIRAFQEGYQIHSHFLRKACDYYENHTDDTYTDDDFYEFIDQLLMDRPIEVAFENMQFEKACNDDDVFVDLTPDDEITDAELAFEEWASQETDYRRHQIDDNYDPDNPFYN